MNRWLALFLTAMSCYFGSLILLSVLISTFDIIFLIGIGEFSSDFIIFYTGTFFVYGLLGFVIYKFVKYLWPLWGWPPWKKRH